MKKRNCLALLLLSSAWLLAHAASLRIALDISHAGVVVGSIPAGPGATHAFLNAGKGLVDLGTLGGTSSQAVAIVWSRGLLRDLGALGSDPHSGRAINDRGPITATPRCRLAFATRSPFSTATAARSTTMAARRADAALPAEADEQARAAAQPAAR